MYPILEMMGLTADTRRRRPSSPQAREDEFYRIFGHVPLHQRLLRRWFGHGRPPVAGADEEHANARGPASDAPGLCTSSAGGCRPSQAAR